MKSIFRILVLPSLGLAAFVWASIAMAATSKEALITQIIREVQLLPANDAARDAAVNDKVSEDTGVRTGGDSRSELTFPDLTITRLGANTIFSFNKSGRTANIDSGSILLRVPKNSGGGSIRSSAVTVAITGTTVIFETDSAGGNKLITLEGTSRLSLKSKPAESRTVRAGQMLDVPPGANTLPMPVEIDLDELMRTHPLIVDFKPLPSLPLITAVAKRQPPPSQTGPVNQPPGIPPAPPPQGPGPTTGGGGTGQKPFPSPTSRPIIYPSPTPTPHPSVTAKPSPTPYTKPTPSATPRGETEPSPSATPRHTSTPKSTPTPTAPPKPTPTPSAAPKPSPSARPTPTPRTTPRTSPSPRPTPKRTPKPTPPPITSQSPGTTKSPGTSPKPTPGPILRTVPKQTSTPRPQSTPRTIRVIKRPTPSPIR